MIEQRSLEWFAARRGRITASNFHVALTGSEIAKTRLGERIRAELRGAVFYEVHAAPLAWGKTHEAGAIADYELTQFGTGELIEVEPVGFLTHQRYDFIGGSPDGLVGDNGLIEVKCPHNEIIHVTAFMNGMDKKHRPQVQGNIWISGRDWCDFISHDPRRPEGYRTHIQRVYRDEAYIQRLEGALLLFWERYVETERQAPNLLEIDIPFLNSGGK